MIVNREQLSKFLIEELYDITNNNYEESGHFEEPLDIDWNMYLSVGDMFTSIILRDEELVIKGILFFFVNTHPHIKTKLVAQQITFFIEKGYRRNSSLMIQYSENYFSERGVNFIRQSARYDSHFCKYLSQKGYTKEDITFLKRI